MKTLVCVMAVVLVTALAMAQQGTTVNFNMVQVNHYNGQEDVEKPVVTPGQRIVIDLQNPLLRQQFLTGAAAGKVDLAPVVVNIEPISNGGDRRTLPWETFTILRGISGTDSFRVSSSRIGCPGTEVKPSVAVSFATGNGWSNPPIRFGPLSENTVCPLGKGYHLDVSVRGDESPVVRLRESRDMYGRR